MIAHVSLDVTDLDRSTDFYRRLLGSEPALVKPGYAKFESAAPPLVLSLVAGAELPRGRVSHLGVRLETPDAFAAATRRLAQEGLAMREEVGIECCYARADKAWVQDPDGNEWEIYVRLGDAERLAPERSACCETTCCAEDGAERPEPLRT